MRINECEIGIQFWENKPPAMRDVLVTLMNTLSLLGEALPIAMRHLADHGLEVQSSFWREFYEFDQMTEITYQMPDGPGPWEIRLAAHIEELRGLVEGRIRDPDGDLSEDGGL